MAADPPKRSDDETEAETVKRRLIETVRERVDEIDRRAVRQRSEGDEQPTGADESA